MRLTTRLLLAGIVMLGLALPAAAQEYRPYGNTPFGPSRDALWLQTKTTTSVWHDRRPSSRRKKHHSEHRSQSHVVIKHIHYGGAVVPLTQPYQYPVYSPWPYVQPYHARTARRPHRSSFRAPGYHGTAQVYFAPGAFSGY